MESKILQYLSRLEFCPICFSPSLEQYQRAVLNMPWLLRRFATDLTFYVNCQLSMWNCTSSGYICQMCALNWSALPLFVWEELKSRFCLPLSNVGRSCFVFVHWGWLRHITSQVRSNPCLMRCLIILLEMGMLGDRWLVLPNISSPILIACVVRVATQSPYHSITR